MPSVLTVVNLLLSHAQAKSKLPECQSGSQASTSDVMMLTYMRERARPSTVPILDPNGTPIWLTRLIGQGGQARVFVGERRGVCYAVKSFNRQQVIDEGNAKHVRRELGILSHLTEDLSHPFIIRLEWAFGYNRNLFLVMNWCPEDLHSRLASHRIYRTEGKLYAAQLLAAIHHLHSNCIMHRDIKPSNILIDYQGNIKLSDFGYAIQFDSSVPKEMHLTYSRVGTQGYKAPELLCELRGPISYPSDIYAFGVVFSQILFAITKKKATYYAPDEISQSRLPRVLQAFLTKLTDPIPSERPHAAIAMKHMWFSSIDWNTVMRCGYQNPYLPQYQGSLSLAVDLEPIPRVAKRKRKIDPVHDQDLLTGFNYVAPQHSESSEADRSTTFQISQLECKGASFPAIISPGDSGRICHFRQSPDLTRVASVDDKKHRSATLKQRRWNWKRSLEHGSGHKSRTGNPENDQVCTATEHGSGHKSRTGNPENDQVCTATVRRRSLVSALCRGILVNGKPATNIIIG